MLLSSQRDDRNKYIPLPVQRDLFYLQTLKNICRRNIRKDRDQNRIEKGVNMKKWYDEEYEFTVEVTGFLHGDHTERYCRNGEEIGDIYKCTYGCPVNTQGYGICSKTMMMLYPLMEAVRSGGDLTRVGGDGEYSKTVVCPDGCVIFKLTARPLGNDNFHTGGFWDYPDETQK